MRSPAAVPASSLGLHRRGDGLYQESSSFERVVAPAQGFQSLALEAQLFGVLGRG